jgi:hypothetical protein
VPVGVIGDFVRPDDANMDSLVSRLVAGGL